MVAKILSKACKLIILAALIALVVPSHASAQNLNYYILQSPSLTAAQTVCQTYGFTMVSTVHAPDTYLVSFPSGYAVQDIKNWMKGNPNVKGFDLNHKFAVPETSALASVVSPSMPSTAPPTDSKLTALFGSKVWLGYAQQPAMYSTNMYTLITTNPPAPPPGTPPMTVAVIDTGIDPLNPVLAPYLVPGFDFTHNVAGYASDLADLNQSTAAVLEQSGVTPLQVAILNQSTAAILEQSTASVLDGTFPKYFGHGTMVAGMIHLANPRTKLMSLKAFSADGTADESNIIQAIYFAVNNHASVINMSFELPQISDGLMKAINFAARNGVILVASAGNDGASSLVYPAAYGNVIAVASVNPQNVQSTFSNFGSDLVTLAAPGEGLVTTYPGNHYAQVWGTSFSAALVSGIVADLIPFGNPNTQIQLQAADMQRALSNAIACGNSGSLGTGCVDALGALNYFKSVQMGKRTN